MANSIRHDTRRRARVRIAEFTKLGAHMLGITAGGKLYLWRSHRWIPLMLSHGRKDSGIEHLVEAPPTAPAAPRVKELVS